DSFLLFCSCFWEFPSLFFLLFRFAFPRFVLLPLFRSFCSGVHLLSTAFFLFLFLLLFWRPSLPPLPFSIHASGFPAPLASALAFLGPSSSSRFLSPLPTQQIKGNPSLP